MTIAEFSNDYVGVQQLPSGKYMAKYFSYEQGQEIIIGNHYTTVDEAISAYNSTLSALYNAAAADSDDYMKELLECFNSPRDSNPQPPLTFSYVQTPSSIETPEIVDAKHESTQANKRRKTDASGNYAPITSHVGYTEHKLEHLLRNITLRDNVFIIDIKYDRSIVPPTQTDTLIQAITHLQSALTNLKSYTKTMLKDNVSAAVHKKIAKKISYTSQQIKDLNRLSDDLIASPELQDMVKAHLQNCASKRTKPKRLNPGR